MSWQEWEGRSGEQVLAWNPFYVDSEDDFAEGVACARMLGTLDNAREATLEHSWVLFHDEWDYELVSAQVALDAQFFDLGSVLHATLLVRG